MLEWLEQLKEKVPAGYETIMQNLNGIPPEETIGYWSMADFKGGSLVMTTYVPPNDDARNLLRRFANVFGLAYQRFADLKQAEAQAREAQIEAALERVRSRTMGMQKSEELKEVIQVVYDQFVHLNIHIEHTGFIMDYKARDDMHIWLADQHEVPFQVTIPYFDCAHWNSFNEAKEKGLDFFANHLSFEEKNRFYQDLFKLIPGVPEETLEYYFGCPGLAISTVLLDNIGLYIENFSGVAYSDEENATLMRFGKVFQQTYTRFLDLQKSEGQAREAQIELGLERVRARAMAMQSSDELKELISTVFIELTKLDIALTRCLIMIYDTLSHDSVWWMANSEAPTDPIGLRIKYHEHAPYLAYIKAWREKNLKWLYVLEGADKKSWDDFLFVETELSHLPDFVIEGMKAPGRVYLNASFNTFGNLTLATLDPLSNEHFDIMLRFAKVFDLTYTRFNDLQKAEAQAREAKIEAALERVRSRTMGMQKSEELKEVIQVVYEQFVHLNVNTEHTGFVMDYKERDDRLIWVASKHGVPSQLTIPYFDSEYYNSFNEAKEKGWDFFATNLSFEEKNNFYQQLFAYIPGLPEDAKEFYFNCPGLAISTVLLENVGLYIENFEGIPYSNEDNAILMRFGKVFQQTYTRFLDLQKAEAQAREAQIEAALERIRARALAMQKSNDLFAVAETLWIQLKNLGQPELESSIIHLYNNELEDFNAWYSYHPPNHPPGEMIMGFTKVSTTSTEWAREVIAMYQSPETEYTIVSSGEKLAEWYKEVSKLAPATVDYNENGGMIIPEILYYHFSNFSGGSLLMISNKEPSPEARDLHKRAAAVFDLAYTRFLDLQKAETQAREAKIEATMEKVRARAMAMQKPGELVEVAQLLRKEMAVLGVEELEGSSIFIHDEISGTTECWYAIQDVREQNTKLVSDQITINLNDTWVGREMLKFYSSDQKQISILMQGENRKEWINYCAQHSKVLQGYYGDSIPDRTYHLLKFSSGYMGAASPGDLSAESWALLQRATTVFSLAYTRFNDLQQAEASAREAVKQAALDRIRAEIASMRTVFDLEKITPLIWNELTVLGIPFIRCGVFIMDEAAKLIHTFLSTPDGKAIGAFHLPYDTPGNISKVIKSLAG